MMKGIIISAVYTALALGAISCSSFDGGTPVKIHSVPAEYQSSAYEVRIDGVPASVMHAGLKTYYVGFDAGKDVEVSVVRKFGDGADAAFAQGATISPEAENIAVRADGDAAKFVLPAAGQYVLFPKDAPRTFDAECLIIASNPPEKNLPALDAPNIVRIKAGVTKRNIDLAAGQTLYLESGAILEGAVNVFNADNASVRGRGIVVYKNGKQNPKKDEGWIVKKDWHPLCVDNSKNFKCEGVTFVNACRTWSLQTRRCYGMEFDNIKLIVVCPQNINGDGFDFYGGGDVKISNCFVRSADDCFAFFSADTAEYGMYADRDAFDKFENFAISNCVLWPTLADVVRIGFNNQHFTTQNVSFKDCDIIYLGTGCWFSPWSLVCSHTTNGGMKSSNSDWLFEDIRFETPACIWGVYNAPSKFKNFTLRRVSLPRGESQKSQLNADAENIVYEDLTICGQKVAAPETVKYKFEKPKKKK